MTISYVGGNAGIEVEFGANVTIPATTAEGHLMLAVLSSNADDSAGYTHAPPVGWSVVDTSYGSADGGSQFATLFSKIAEPGDPATIVNFPVTPTGTKDALALAVYSGTITTPVISAHGILAHNATIDANVPLPSVTVPELPATLVTAATKKGGSVEILMTPPAGITARAKGFVTGGGAIASVFGDGAAGATGATSLAPWTTDISTANGVGFVVALTEGDPPTPTQPIFRRYTVTGWFPAIT